MTTNEWHYIKSSDLRDNEPMEITMSAPYVGDIIGKLQRDEPTTMFHLNNTSESVSWVERYSFTYDEIDHYDIIGMVIHNDALGCSK